MEAGRNVWSGRCGKYWKRPGGQRRKKRAHEQGSIPDRPGRTRGAKLIHRFLDRLLEERSLKVLESSGLQGSRRWSIVEAPASLAGGARCSAIQVSFEIDQEWIDLEVVGEQDGFREHDIPARMLETLERHTPPNDQTRRWQEECSEFRKNAAEQRKLMREIRRVHRETQREVPIVMEKLRANFRATKGDTTGKHDNPTLEYYVMDKTISPLTDSPPGSSPLSRSG